MTFRCSRLDYLRVSDSRCWVNSISGLKRMLRHNLFMSSGKNVLYLCGEGEHKGTSDNVAGEHLHILQLEEKEYSLSIITLPKLFLFVYVYVYALYMLSIYNAYI